jgi:hypothetical protein
MLFMVGNRNRGQPMEILGNVKIKIQRVIIVLLYFVCISISYSLFSAICYLDQFDKLMNVVVTGFAEQGLNAVLYNKNQDFRKYVSLVPTSAHTGEG